MDTSIMNMICSHIDGESFRGKRILEIGSREVSGPSVRKLFKTVSPALYHGIDIVDGPGVDEVISISDYVEKNPKKEGFDLVVCTEVFEHYKNWWELVECLAWVISDGGLILFTTPGIKFPFHPHERDFWRADPNDLKTLFSCMCNDMHCKESFITESTDQKHIFAKVVFEFNTFQSRKEMFYFMLENMKVHNVLVGDKISPREWNKIITSGDWFND